MAGNGAPRKLEVPVLVNLMIEAKTLKGVDRQAKALSKKHGFRIYRADIIREVLENYLKVSGV